MNKSLFTYSIIFLILTSLFGFNFFLNLIGNLLLLIFLIPLLILAVLLISFNSLKSKVNTCNQCGTLTLGINNISNKRFPIRFKKKLNPKREVNIKKIIE